MKTRVVTLNKLLLIIFPLIVGNVRPAPTLAAEPPLEIDITHTSIEDLLQMSVTSVSKTREAFWGSSAAVYVLTSEDIRRSGATTIPEALRLVPGVQVARIDANKWAVSIRGFNSRTSNKLLVLFDGRVVYDHLFSGVLWETRDVMLEDVERIEVVRGPGGTLWGLNAVNGVINVITKNARDTQGGLVVGGGGTEELGFGEARYGMQFGDDSFLRFYGMHHLRDEGSLPGMSPDDESRFTKGGFRFDSFFSERDLFTLQGDIYDSTQGNVDSELAPDQENQGGNIMSRWTHTFSDQSTLTTFGYYDRRELDTNVLGEDRDTFLFDLQYEFSPIERHRVIAGIDFQVTTDEEDNSPVLALFPDERTDHYVTAFVEDRVELVAEELFVTVGTKIGYNDYTGFEYQPTIRGSWILNEDHSFWSAISRAVRIPSRLEDDVVIFLPGGAGEFAGNRNMDSERLLAYEIGYRMRPAEDVFVDIATFYNVYDGLLTTEGVTIGNRAAGDTYGVETGITWNPVKDWQLELAYAFFQLELDLDTESLESPERIDAVESTDPHNQVSLQSRYNLGPHWQFDGAIRYVDNLAGLNVESYIVADLRLGYLVNENIEVSIVGQNLFDSAHFEQGGMSATEVEQGVYGKVVVHF